MAVFQVSFMAESLGRTVPLTVILPTDKVYFGDTPRRAEGKPYKTLYLLHGIIGSEQDWLCGTAIKRYAEDRDLAVVMPAGENSFYLDQPWHTAMYGTFIGRELVEFTRRTFPLSRRREDTYIGGLSMGGFGAMRNGLKYRDTFGAIISLSGAFITDESLLVKVEQPRFPSETEEYKHGVFGPDLAAALDSDSNPFWQIARMGEEKAAFPPVFMACGEQDPLLEKNEAIAQALRRAGAELRYVTAPGGHAWDFWDRYILEALEWLPLEGSAAGVSSGNVGL